MARMKDIKMRCENTFNIIKEKLKSDRSGDHSLKLPYDTSQALANIAVTKDFCSEMKRIGSYGLATYSITDDEKKKKKTLNALAGLFKDTSTKFSENDPKRGPLNYSALAFENIIQFTNAYRKQLENSVMEPLDNLEKMCSEIQEMDKKLHTLKRDITMLLDKQMKLEEQTSQDDQKIMVLKEQIMMAQAEYETLSELFIQKILVFEASNFRHAEALHDMILIRTEYHEKCAKTLLKYIPQCNTYIEEKRSPLSFGTPLENHLRETKRFIAYPLEFCIKSLSDINSLRQEGLFRVSGSMNKANLLCSVLNLMKCEYIEVDWPPHVVADALKRYLREMPVSLLGKIAHSDWEICFEKSKSGNKQESYKKIKDLLGKLPNSYYQNLEYLIRFLNTVVCEKTYNLMSIQNICTVFVPNLFKSSISDSLTVSGMNLESNACFNFILESLIKDSNFFFPHSDQTRSSPNDIEKLKKNYSQQSSRNEESSSDRASDGRERVCHRTNSVVERYMNVINSANNENNGKKNVSMSISQRRRQQLEVHPVNFEELENEIGSESGNSEYYSIVSEPDSINPPIPPRKMQK